LATDYWYTPYYVSIDERECKFWQEKQGRVSSETMNGWFFLEVARYTKVHIIYCTTFQYV